MRTKLIHGLIVLFVGLTVLAPRQIGATGACTCARFNNFKDHGCHDTPGGAGSADSSTPKPCPCKDKTPGLAGPDAGDIATGALGMPQWWVDEPYINLHVVDKPLSYTTAAGQEMSFQFFYKQRYMWPKVDQIPSLPFVNLSRDGNPLVFPYAYLMRSYGGTNGYFSGMTNAAWMHNWMMDIVYWDAAWEAKAISPGTSTVPFSNNFEALVFRPEGDIQYFTYNAGIANTTRTNDPISKVKLTSYPHYFPDLENAMAATNGIYWGSTTNGLKLLHPDGSQDIFSLGFSGVSGSGFYHGVYDSTSHALLTQRIDPQGRITSIGYERFTNSGNIWYRIRYVVDPDKRTNTLVYANASNWNLQEIDDPFGRRAALSYTSSNWPSSITDAVGTSNTFVYPIIGSFKSSGWLSSLTTPYGTTSFSYYSLLKVTQVCPIAFPT